MTIEFILPARMIIFNCIHVQQLSAATWAYHYYLPALILMSNKVYNLVIKAVRNIINKEIPINFSLKENSLPPTTQF